MSHQAQTNEEDEALLVELTQCGDKAAFERLLRRLYTPLHKYVSNLVGDSTADDILQEVSLKIFQQVKQLREPKVFRAWVFRVATRISFAHLKRERRWRELENDPDLIRAFPTSSPCDDENPDANFLTLLDRVSPASRAVLLLHYQQHLSLEETAAILEIPLGTAKSRLAYGVATIRNFIKEKEHR